ncbi:DUF6893 family small protein [Arthrobacter sp. NA-172]
MRAIGMVAVWMLALVGLGAVYVGLRSIPDIQRYMKVRRM